VQEDEGNGLSAEKDHSGFEERKEDLMEYIFEGKRYLLKQLSDAWFLILVDQKEGEYIKPYELNESGAFIFKEFCDEKTEEEIAHEIADNDPENYETIIKDIVDFRLELEKELNKSV
ncbi:MAG: PqqD family protein, partial [Erysipelotrichaceae bacterium]|nr:PqqD family protein [Erysipelotrichaceae bacterium]